VTAVQPPPSLQRATAGQLRPPQQQAPAAPMGSGFLGGALKTAAGVAGGVMLAEGISSLFHHNSQPQEIVEIIKEEPRSLPATVTRVMAVAVVGATISSASPATTAGATTPAVLPTPITAAMTAACLAATMTIRLSDGLHSTGTLIVRGAATACRRWRTFGSTAGKPVGVSLLAIGPSDRQ
jgi:hypothetical protein